MQNNWFHHLSLMNRRKRSHLSLQEKKYIFDLAIKYPEDKGLICRSYKLSESALRRIQRSNSNSQNGGSPDNIHIENLDLDPALLSDAIYKIVEPPKVPIWLDDIQAFLKDEQQVVVPLSKIRRHLKESLKYSYKKGSPRPPSCITTRSRLFKGLFAVKLLSYMKSGRILANIDEWSFERSIRQNYSWLPTGQNWSILHEPIEGKWSLILATFSNFEWIAFLKCGTINSKFFLLFLKILESLVWSSSEDAIKQPLLLLDNASIHKSKLIRVALSSSKLELRFLTAYTPELAPVEISFRAIKAKLRKQVAGVKVDFTKEKFFKLIIATIEQLKAKTWEQCWYSAIKESRQWILEAFKLIGEDGSRSIDDSTKKLIQN